MAHYASVEENLENLHLESTKFVNSLDPAVRQRVHDLKGIQQEKNQVARQFESELQALERKYWPLYQPLFKKRYHVVNPGIPGFWLKAMMNHPDVSITISSRDKSALKHLTDIQGEYLGEKGFQITFHFSSNAYFTNASLIKTYHYKADTTTGLLTPCHSTGDVINWKPKHNLTLDITQDKEQHHQKSESVTARTDSFFDFFSPPKAVNPNVDEHPDESDEWLRTMDFEVGEALKNELIPRAVYWYTGEAAEDLNMDDEIAAGSNESGGSDDFGSDDGLDDLSDIGSDEDF